jgi:hypothetical protein
MAYRQFKGKVDLHDGRLLVDPLHASVGGGDFKGRLEMDTGGEKPTLSLSATIDQMDMQQIMEELKQSGMMEGIIDARADFRSRGASVAALMAGLDGQLLMVSGEGRVNNRSFGYLGADLMEQVFGLFTPAGKKDASTPINCFVGRIDVDDGLANISKLIIDTPTMSVVGEGHVNLETEQLDLAIHTVPKRGVRGVSLNLGELVPFRLSGTLARPALAVDRTKGAITAGKAVGGTLLFGPFGIAAALVRESGQSENPCIDAIKAAEQGVQVEKEEGITEKATRGVQEGAEQARKLFYKIFGD